MNSLKITKRYGKFPRGSHELLEGSASKRRILVAGWGVVTTCFGDGIISYVGWKDSFNHIS
jgi:hypothetical protein